MRNSKLLGPFLLLLAQTCGAQNIDDSNCLSHLGGGGFGDFDCYNAHIKSLTADSEAVAAKLKETMPKGSQNLARLDSYMRTQDQAQQYCAISVDAVQGWHPDTEKKTHIDMYDVTDARCRYDIRKHQNEFLHELLDEVNGS